MTNDALTDSLAADLVRDCHITCIECQGEGCTGCPSAFCELPRLVSHCGEYMHQDCVAAFDRHITNRCTGDVCNCGAPEHVEDAGTAKTVVEAYETTSAVSAGWLARLAAVAALVLVAVTANGCAAHAQPVEVESVGTLTPSYHSIAVAPVHHDEPPAMGEIAGSADDDDGAAPVATASDAGADAAPEVVDKGGGIKMGGEL